VTVNGRQLDSHEFTGVSQKTIKIYPPPKESGTDYVDLAIAKRNLLKTLNQKLDPYKNLLEDVLLKTKIKYADHSKYEQLFNTK
jgi:hypothetical protein